MKSQDIFILLKLVSLAQQMNDGDDKSVPPEISSYSNRGLEASTGVSKSEVNASIKRSIEAGMAKLDRKTKLPKANVNALIEFIIHGIKYVYPVKPSGIVRGIPTSIAAPVLEGKIMTSGEFICVWPDALGEQMGQGITPLYKTVPMAVKKDPRLYEYLALIDAIRLGRGRESTFAAKVLKEKLRG